MDKKIRIGFCTDLSGPYQSVDGPGGASAIRMAIEDSRAVLQNREVQVVCGDHLNDPDVARKIAADWLREDAVDMIISGVNSDTSLALTEVAVEARCPVFVVGAGTAVQTAERPSEFVVQYAYNTAALATVPAIALSERQLDRWFYITADYPFGRELEHYGRRAVVGMNGQVVGTATNPHEEQDFAPYIRKALQSGANVLGLANGHAALLYAIRALKELGATEKLTVVGLLTFINDIHEIGLEEAQGLLLCDSWFWTRDQAAQAWGERYFANTGSMPSSLQAADYSATIQYLKAIARAGSLEWQDVSRQLRGQELTDMYLQHGRLRADGVLLHDMHLLRVKQPSDSRGAWDLYDNVAVVDGQRAFPS